MDTIDAEAPRGWPPGKGGKGGKKLPPMVMIAGAILIMIFVFGALMAVTGKLGIVSVADDEVSVKVNYLTGEREVTNRPGFQIYLPFLQEVFLFDKSPQKFLMEGTSFRNESHVPQLTVRARDGSNFRFNTLEIQYRLIPGEAGFVLTDSGSGEAFKAHWIRAYARSILRDEFGRFTPQEVANTTTYSEATNNSKNRLNELLLGHGIEVIQIVTPKPSFDEKYERAIEDRKVADQDVERLIAMEDQLLRERQRELAAVEKDKEIELRSLRGDLEQARVNAERDAIQVTKSADAYAIEQRALGTAEAAERIAKARGLTAKYSKEAEGLLAKAEALEQRGEVVIREALINKLRSIRFKFVPYSRDPAPRRLEHTESQTANNRRNLDESVIDGGTQ
ncbi:MAG: regulator of protease activity HflC (stomatin/prohibitin superfamily) [Planctomycetota bacterium]|jgi:regulator of protease activity HflC (stomatin/prohibitin superfamily)